LQNFKVNHYPSFRQRKSRRERGIWQRRFWEHLLRDQTDFNRHVDYIHWNPVKHGWVERVRDWPYSSFRRYVEQGVYPESWGNDERLDIIEGIEYLE
jgi:putative transposase